MAVSKNVRAPPPRSSGVFFFLPSEGSDRASNKKNVNFRGPGPGPGLGIASAEGAESGHFGGVCGFVPTLNADRTSGIFIFFGPSARISPAQTPDPFPGERDELIFFQLNASSSSGPPAPPPLSLRA